MVRKETSTYKGFHSTFAALLLIKEFLLGSGSLGSQPRRGKTPSRSAAAYLGSAPVGSEILHVVSIYVYMYICIHVYITTTTTTNNDNDNDNNDNNDNDNNDNNSNNSSNDNNNDNDDNNSNTTTNNT